MIKDNFNNKSDKDWWFEERITVIWISNGKTYSKYLYYTVACLCSLSEFVIFDRIVSLIFLSKDIYIILVRNGAYLYVFVQHN